VEVRGQGEVGCHVTTLRSRPPFRPVSGEWTRDGAGGRVMDATHESMSQMPVRPRSTSSNVSIATPTVTPCRVIDRIRCGREQVRSLLSAFSSSHVSTPAAICPPRGTGTPRRYITVTEPSRGQGSPSTRTRYRRFSTWMSPVKGTPPIVTASMSCTGPGSAISHGAPWYSHGPLYHSPSTRYGARVRRYCRLYGPRPQNVDSRTPAHAHGSTGSTTSVSRHRPRFLPVQAHRNATAISSSRSRRSLVSASASSGSAHSAAE